MAGRALFKALLVALALAAAIPLLAAEYDLFLKSDYGSARFSLNTQTGEFRWEDKQKKLDVTGTGTLHFPSLGPIIFSFSGPAPGYDWISVSLKIYGTTATGYLAAFPEGEKVKKVVSNFYDRNTEDDWPDHGSRKASRPNAKVDAIKPTPSEVPQAPPPSPPN